MEREDGALLVPVLGGPYRVDGFEGSWSFTTVDSDDAWVADCAWTLHSKGYVRGLVGRPARSTYLHAEIARRSNLGASQVDHANLDKLDNRRHNLRAARPGQNMAHQRKRAGEYSSPFKGVHRHSTSGAWIAQITSGWQTIHLGSFRSPEDAAAAYDDKAIELHGEFAVLNFPRRRDR